MRKKCKIFLTKKAQKDLKRLDVDIADRILSKLEFYEKSENPLFYAEKLRDLSLGHYKFRVGKYRILFDLCEQVDFVVLNILAIRHRREVYLRD